jgi:ribosomal protein S18 acetylase RimI-like enzyme
VRIVRVTEPSELVALYRFRHDIYVDDIGWLEPDPTGLIRDGYDDGAYNYAAYSDNDRIVGSVRVVPDGPTGLPLERVAPLNGFREGKRLVELCRLVTDPSLRIGSRLGGLLMKAGYQRAVLHGATHIALDTYVGDEEACDLYRKMGFEDVTGLYEDPEWRCELPVITLALDVEQALKEWPIEKAGLFRFFTSPDSAIDHG